MEKLHFSIGLVLTLVAFIQAQQVFTIVPDPNPIPEDTGLYMVTVTRTCTGICPAEYQKLRVKSDLSDPGASTTAFVDYVTVDVAITFSQADTSQTFDIFILNDVVADSMCLEVFVLETLELNDILFTNILPTVATGSKVNFSILDANPSIGTVAFAFTNTNPLVLVEPYADFTSEITLERTCTGGSCPCTAQVARVRTIDVTANAGSDYTSLPLTDVTFEPSDPTGTAKMFNVMVTGDTVPENDERFRVEVANVDGTAPSPAVTLDVEIRDDVVDITCTPQPATKREDPSSESVSVTLIRVGGYSYAASCLLITISDTATHRDDYLLPIEDENIQFAAANDPFTSQPQQNSVAIQIYDDNIIEDTEVFNVWVAGVSTVPRGYVAIAGRVLVPITILDNDVQQVFTIVADPNPIPEPAGSAGPYVVTVTRTCTGTCPADDQELRIQSDQSDPAASATANVDYIPVDVTITFSQADTSQTFTMTILNDGVADSTCLEVLVLETLSLNGILFGNIPTETTTGSKVNFNILDVNPSMGTAAFAFTQTDPLVVVEADITNEITLTRTCTGGCPCTAQVARVRTIDGTANAGSDYTSLPLTDVTFEPSDPTGTAKMFSVMVTDDILSENDERFTVEVANVDGTAPSPAVTMGFEIRDDDITCTPQPATKREDPSSESVSVTLIRVGGYSFAASCVLVTSGPLTATFRDDYLLPIENENIQFAAANDPFTSQPQQNSVQILIYDDNIREDTEVFNVFVGGFSTVPRGYVSVGDRVDVPITILDNDAEFAFEESTYTVLEGASDCSFEPTKMGIRVVIDRRTGYNQRSAIVAITASSGSAESGTDFPAVNEMQVTFDSGDLTKGVCVEITDDIMYENQETFTLTLSDPTGMEAISADKGSTTVTIQDNDAEICFDTTMSYEVLESSGYIRVTFKREGYLDRDTNIRIYTEAGTATVFVPNALDDFSYYSMRFPYSTYFFSGSNTATARFSIRSDGLTEEDETFNLHLETGLEDIGLIDGQTNDDFGGCNTMTVTIVDTDPEFGFKSAAYSVREGVQCSCDSSKKGVCVTLERKGYAAKEAFIGLTSSNVGLTTVAQASDFTALTNFVVTFEENVIEKEVCIEIADDIDVETGNNEMFRISASRGSGNIISGQEEVIISIEDNDAKISIRDANTILKVGEGAGTASITFSRTGYIDRQQTFLVSTQDMVEDAANLQAMSGTDCAITAEDCDFQKITDQLVTFQSGESMVSINIQINNDFAKENAEKFRVEIKSDPANPECISTTDNQREVEIEDDDACVYLVDSATTGLEGDKVTLTLGREPNTAIGRVQSVFVGTREIDTINGRATSGSDFADRAGFRVTFDVNEETKTAEITLIDDDIVEQEEKFVVFIFNQNECIDPDRKETIITIEDDDAKCTIQAPALSAPLSEAIGSATSAADRTVCFSVYRVGSTKKAGTCDVKTINSEIDIIRYGLTDESVKHIATSSNDFYEKEQTINFQIGEDSKVGNDGFCVTIRDDDVCELPEKLYAVITNTPAPFDKFTQASSVTIVDDSPEKFLFVQPYNFEANEGETHITLTVNRCGDTSQEGRCRIRFESDTAQMGRRKRQDFNLPSTQELVFPPGSIEATVDVPIVNDDAVEGQEHFRVIIEAITGDVIPGSVVAQVTILDDDSFYSIELPQYYISEGDNLLINVIRNSNYLGSPGSVDISTKTNVEATGITDFQVLQNHTVNFAPNQRIAPVTIAIPDDQMSEFTELFEVYLSNPDGALVENFTSAIVSILDNDDVYYQFEDTEYRVLEAAGEVKVSVERYGSLQNPGSVRVEFREASYHGNDEAEANVDFSTTDTVVNFPPGDHTAEAYFRIIDDIQREDLETFGMFLADPPQGEYLFSPMDDAIVYITDNDENPRVDYMMDKTSIEVDETIGTVDILIIRVSSSSYLPSGSAEVIIRENSASEGQDFSIGSRVAFFGENDVEARLPINIISSSEVEPNEIFSVVLSKVEGGNAQIGFPSQTDVTIDDHTASFSFEVTTVSVSESQRVLAVAIQRTGNTEGASSVGIVSVSGSASDSEDYETVNSRVTFDRNSNKETYQVFIVIDSAIEDSETFNLRLVDPSSGAVIGVHDLLEVTIIDSTARTPSDSPNLEACYSFGQNTYNVNEDDGKVYFTIRREGSATSVPGRVRFYTQAGNADPGRDYTSKETQIFFEAGVTIMTVEVEILKHDGDEDREFFTVHLTDPEGGNARICNGVATVNIRDVAFEETLTTGIIIAIAVSGIFLILLLLAFLICICFRPRPRERENVVMMRRQQEPNPEPIILEPENEPIEYIEPEPEPLTVIKRVRVPVRVHGPPPNRRSYASYGLPPPQDNFVLYGPSVGPYGPIGATNFGVPRPGYENYGNPPRPGYENYGPPPPY